MKAVLTLTLRSPFLIGGEQELAAGLDAVLLRNAAGKAIIPGTAIKGLVRDALESLAALGHPKLNDTRIAGWFGEKSPEGLGNEPKPGARALAFSDLVEQTEHTQKGDHYARVAIDSGTGSALTGALQFIELPWAVGAEVVFTGKVQGDAGALDADTLALLNLALNAIPAIGSMRGMGFGQIAGRSLVPDKPPMNPPEKPEPVTPGADQDLLLLVNFDSAFVVAAERPDANVFVGQDLVPGGALKGALAERIGSDPGAAALLSAVTIHHGYPVPDAAEDRAHDFAPRTIARSIALAPGAASPALIDLIDRVKPPLVDRGPQLGYAPLALAPDWKPSERIMVTQALAQANGFAPALTATPQRERRTRTAIDGKSGTARYDPATGGLLFSHDAVSPIDAAGKPLVWAFRVSGTADDLAGFSAIVARQSLTIGKLNTLATVSSVHAIPVREPGSIAKQLVLTLATPAVLNGFSELEAAKGLVDTVYAAYFAAQHPALKLERFFASQKLVTGYQAIRFRSNPERFEPWVLTEAGSTFLLSVDAAEGGAETVANLVAGWTRFGLPPVGTQAIDAWKHHPFLRENGFGQIVVGAMKLPPFPASFSIVKGGAA